MTYDLILHNDAGIVDGPSNSTSSTEIEAPNDLAAIRRAIEEAKRDPTIGAFYLARRDGRTVAAVNLR